MTRFLDLLAKPAESSLIVQGNEAFSLGVIHAGYHAADGYPGTPSTEVIDKSLMYVQDKIKVGWSVNEAVAVGVAVGHSVAGFDTVCTMKIPGLFQGGDAVSTSAFSPIHGGALVFYIAADYFPSSTQHIVDARYFLKSCFLPVIEPRTHQEMYEAPFWAADISREFNTAVVILPSGILCHSEGLIVTRDARTITPREPQDTIKGWLSTPQMARVNYNELMRERRPRFQKWLEEITVSKAATLHIPGSFPVAKTITGTENWGIITVGQTALLVEESLAICGASTQPWRMQLALSNPLPMAAITEFAGKVKGPIFVIEDGYRFLQEQLLLNGIPVRGKDEDETLTEWTPQDVIQYLQNAGMLAKNAATQAINVPNILKTSADSQLTAPKRPPAICPGCPYRSFGLVVDKLKKRKKIHTVFGDIGCSTLLHFMNSIDTVLCMGASESMRQGFVSSRPDFAHKTISVIGDSCECHSGMDATRNALFRNIPGVKVILDNHITGMTGGQLAPSSATTWEGNEPKFNLRKAIEAEGCRTVTVDSYDIAAVEKTLTEALELAAQGEFSVLILEGACIQLAPASVKVGENSIDYEKCKKCGMCRVCPGMEIGEDSTPRFTNLCTNCAGNKNVCEQRCNFGAITKTASGKCGTTAKENLKNKEIDYSKLFTYLPMSERHAGGAVSTRNAGSGSLAPSMRLAIRGIGGQGNLFFGKILAEVTSRTPYAKTNIIKGETHGMAQLGGPVISTFSCGDVHSSVLAPGSADVLVAMEFSEVLRPGFLSLLKPGGILLVNRFKAVPLSIKSKEYPSEEAILSELKQYPCDLIFVNANELAYSQGDSKGKTANVVILGVLSTLPPFNAIEESIWLAALKDISPNEKINSINHQAFTAGKKLALS